MPKKDISYLNQDLIILQKLLEYGKPMTFRKRISGYGLKEYDFDGADIKIPKILSRKVFQGRKNKLLSLKFIRKIITKERGELFGITPLGIIFLCQHTELDKQSTRQISNILEFHLHETFNKNRQYQFNIIEKQLEKTNLENKVIENLIKVLKNIQISNRYSSQEIIFLYNHSNVIPIVFEKYEIKNGSIHISSEKTFPEIKKINEESFFGMLSYFILGAFAHSYVIEDFVMGGTIIEMVLNEIVDYRKKNKNIFRWFSIFQEALTDIIKKQNHFVNKFKILSETN